MGSLKANKLNNLTAKEWTLYSASVILFSSKIGLLKRICLIYSMKNDKIGYFSFQKKPKWRKKTYFSRQFHSEYSRKSKYNLIIIDLHVVNSILHYQNAELWIEKHVTSFFETLEENKYLLVLVKDFNEPESKINYFPTHQFINLILGKYNFLQTDLWALSNIKNENYSPSFLLCFKKSTKKPKYSKIIDPHDFITRCSTNYINHNYSCPNIIEGFSSIREPEYLKHGATFPQTLIEFFLKIFTRKKGLVLDIFAGVGLSLFAAESLQRNAIGLELNPKYVKWANQLRKRKFGNLAKYISTENSDHSEIRFINDDNRNLLAYVEKNSVDLMITSPPYFNILHKVA
ncbi:MAG: DNA methyltransferase, partial [Candidatus Hodarchaeota archaeon]